MALTNAQIQAAYRARHIKDSASARRLDLVIDADSVTAIKRLAAHYRVTQRAMLQTIIGDAQQAVLATMDSDRQRAYFESVQAK